MYAKKHWKMPDEPAWFYKLDELVYQGYRQGMTVPLLSLDYLKQSNSEGFGFTTEREFWREGASRPFAEVDFCCVTGGILVIGEAKKENVLAQSASEENSEVNKYLRIANSLCARQVVFATLSDTWSERTVRSATAAFAQAPEIRSLFLNAGQLMQ